MTTKGIPLNTSFMFEGEYFRLVMEDGLIFPEVWEPDTEDWSRESVDFFDVLQAVVDGQQSEPRRDPSHWTQPITPLNIRLLKAIYRDALTKRLLREQQRHENNPLPGKEEEQENEG